MSSVPYRPPKPPMIFKPTTAKQKRRAQKKGAQTMKQQAALKRTSFLTP
jgi:hypothetical protein